MDERAYSTSLGKEVVRSDNSSQSLEKIRGKILGIFAQNGSAFVAIGGGSSVGKTSLFLPVLSQGLGNLISINGDDYCIGSLESSLLHGKPNLHVPEDFSLGLLHSHLTDLRNGKPVDKPLYSFDIRARVGSQRLDPAPIVIVEGIFALHPLLHDVVDINIFVSADDHSRFIRRLIRQRRSSKQSDLERVCDYIDLTYPHHYLDILPTSANADFIIENRYDPLLESDRIPTVQAEQIFSGERQESVFENLFPQSVVGRFTRYYYTHAGFRDGEVLCITSNTQGGNMLFYGLETVKDGQGFFKTPAVIFNLEDSVIDLQKAGYRRVQVVEGFERTAKINALSAKLIKLDSGETVIQLSVFGKKDDIQGGLPFNVLEDLGLNPINQTLYVWERQMFVA